MSTAEPIYPVRLDVEYPERLSRWLIFVKSLVVIPHLIIVYALILVAEVLTFIAWFVILFTGRYPRGMFNFVVGVLRWQNNAAAYTALLRDEYPPFSLSAGQYPVTFDVEYPENLSRWLIFVKWLLIIPHLIILLFLLVVYGIVFYIAWFAILFTTRYPRGLFNFTVGVLRWSARINVYILLLRDEYPPFSLQQTKSGANEAQRVSATRPTLEDAPEAERTRLPNSGEDTLGKIERLAALHSAGVLTDDEFAAKKAELLSRL